MCNLSEGFYEDGIKRGIKRGIKQGVEQGVKQGARETKAKMIQAFQMLKEKVSVSEIVKETGLAEEDVRQMKLLL